MGDPTATNSTATTVNKVINDGVQAGERAAETAIETALDTAVPAFALPVLKQVSDEVIHLIVGKIADEVSLQLQTFGTFIVIDLQTNAEKTKLSQALQNLMIAEKSGGAAAIQKAIQAYADAQSALIHSDGSATPST
jgi:hypothetical protein